VGVYVGNELANLAFAAGELGRNGAQLVQGIKGVAFGLLLDECEAEVPAGSDVVNVNRGRRYAFGTSEPDCTPLMRKPPS
jgi:hypothetical protein